MTRLYIFAEGQTEQTYGDTVLKKHLAAFGVYVQGPILIAHARKKGVTHRGGGRRYVPMKNDICRFLQQEKGRDVYFTTMIDLYALPVDFPGMSEAERATSRAVRSCLEVGGAFRRGHRRSLGTSHSVHSAHSIARIRGDLVLSPNCVCFVLRSLPATNRASGRNFQGLQVSRIDRRRRAYGPVQTHYGTFSRLRRRKIRGGTANRRRDRA